MAKKNTLTAGEALHTLFQEVFKLQASLSDIIDRVHEHVGLTTSNLRIMGVLIEKGAASVPDIAAHLGVSRQFVQTVCNDLSSQGLLEFFENPRHKRSKLADLTTEGRDAFFTARKKENQLIERALPHIASDQAHAASQLLHHINEELKKRSGPVALQ